MRRIVVLLVQAQKEGKTARNLPSSSLTYCDSLVYCDRESHEVCKQLSADAHTEQAMLCGGKTGQPWHCPVNRLAVESMRDL